MNISVIGTGYVGLPAGTALASKGHKVTCVDIDEEKVERINQGECPIHEEGLPELLGEQVAEENLKATTDTISAVQNSDITFLSVGTPMNDDGSINLDYIKQATEDLAEGLKEKDGYHVVVVKSTVVPTTTEEEIIPILEEVSGKKAGEDFGVCMNPEFLREGTALQDFLDPDRIVIGELDERSGDQIEEMYSGFDAPIMRTSLKAAELIKYASNSLLATKISFINEIGNLCKELGIDVYEVAD
jgi:UDPglucose 6-dehydrogenase